MCITCSHDHTVKIWDSETGEFRHTLTPHTQPVEALAVLLSARVFACGSNDNIVIYWSCVSLEALRVIKFPDYFDTLLIGRDDDLFAGVHDHDVMSCNTLTG